MQPVKVSQDQEWHCYFLTLYGSVPKGLTRLCKKGTAYRVYWEEIENQPAIFKDEGTRPIYRAVPPRYIESPSDSISGMFRNSLFWDPASGSCIKLYSNLISGLYFPESIMSTCQWGLWGKQDNLKHHCGLEPNDCQLRDFYEGDSDLCLRPYSQVVIETLHYLAEVCRQPREIIVPWSRRSSVRKGKRRRICSYVCRDWKK